MTSSQFIGPPVPVDVVHDEVVIGQGTFNTGATTVLIEGRYNLRPGSIEGTAFSYAFEMGDGGKGDICTVSADWPGLLPPLPRTSGRWENLPNPNASDLRITLFDGGSILYLWEVSPENPANPTGIRVSITGADPQGGAATLLFRFVPAPQAQAGVGS